MTVARRILEGLRAPYVALERGRGTSGGARYRKLILWQLLATVVIMTIVTPHLLAGLDLAAHDPHTDLRFKGASIVVVRRDKAHDGDYDKGGRVQIAGSEFVSAHAPGLVPLWIALVSLYGTWLIVEWIVAALSYEYADAITEALCIDLGLPHKPSKLDRPPKLRVDLRWMFRRVWRQVLAAIVFGSGAPLFLVARLVPRIGHFLSTLVVSAWGVYWLLVTTAAKSDLAWQVVAPRPPWFLRAWTLLTTRVPGFRWWLPRTYGRLWSRVTIKMHGAADLLEEAPWQTAGLSILRVVSNIPVVALVLKPLLPVAATLVYTHHREKMGAPPVA